MELLISTLVAAAAGALGAMGLGGGGVLLLWLALTGTDQLAAQGLNLAFILPVGLLGLWSHRKNGLVDFRTALPMVAGGLLGLGAGVFLAGRLGSLLLSRLFGGLVGIIALRELWSAWRLFREKGWGLLSKSSQDPPA